MRWCDLISSIISSSSVVLACNSSCLNGLCGHAASPCVREWGVMCCLGGCEVRAELQGDSAGADASLGNTQSLPHGFG